MYVGTPRWEPPELDPETTFGLLVLEGLIGRRVRVGRAVTTELLSCGDIVRPWDTPAAFNAIPCESDWRVFRTTRLAVLDERITRLIGTRPQLITAFSGRLLRRAQRSYYLMAVTHLTRVEDRLLATLWHLASNWGRVTPQGVRIPFRLTHEVMGEIIGAQRPSVTIALRELKRRQQVTVSHDGAYVLLRDPSDWPAQPRTLVAAVHRGT